MSLPAIMKTIWCFVSVHQYIILLAGVAQSVERVALIASNCRRDHLKVAGSSPAFGYSYPRYKVV